MRLVQIPFPAILSIVLPLWVLMRIRKAHRSKQFSTSREVIVQLFFVYTCVLFILTMRPFIFQLPWIGPRRDIAFDIYLFEELRNMAVGSEMYQLLYSGGNVAMLIPFGLLLPLLFPFARHFFVTLVLGFALSLTIETTQMIFTLTRTGTVDDLVFNTIGTMIGYVVYQIIGDRIAPST